MTGRRFAAIACASLASTLIVACSHAFATSQSLRTAASPDQTLTCVKEKLTALKYRQTSINTEDYRVVAQQFDTTQRRSDTQFRRTINRIEATMKARGDGPTELVVTGRTFDEYTTQRGPTEEERKASDRATAAVDSVVGACGGSAAAASPTAVPPAN